MTHLNHEAVQKVMEISGISELNPGQTKALEAGLLDNGNFVVAAPTASGKTLLAEIKILDVVKKNKKALYIAPLRALASEKYDEFKEKYEKLGLRIAISVGDMDSADNWLGNYDIIVCTSEKLDSLMRHESPWIGDVGLVVVDEIHIMNSAERGPTLEVVLTKLRHLINPQILGLSATISNYNELADWLGAKSVKSDYRPVKLYKGICFEGDVAFNPKKDRKINIDENPLFDIISDTLKIKKQALVFISTRKHTESAAEKIGDKTFLSLSDDERVSLEEVSQKIENALEHKTTQCERLANCVRKGSAFHHAGLANPQRKIIEDAFKKGWIKALTATPTLCLSGNSKVWTGISEVNASRLDATKHVYALHKNNLIHIKVDKVERIENISKLLQISSVSGHSIKVTPNHRMLIKREGRKILAHAKDITKKDKIATIGRLNFAETSNPHLSNFVKDNKMPCADRVFDRDLSYFIGVMLGDGYSGAEIKEGKIIYKGSPSIVGNDHEIFLNIKRVCGQLDASWRETKNYYGTPQVVLDKSKWFREFLVRSGIGVGDKKHISESLMKMSNENISSLLSGLFDTDGCVEKKGLISFSNTSETLIKQVQKLLLRFGIVSRVRKREGGKMKIYDKEYQTKPYFELLIGNKNSIIDFHILVGFVIKRKMDDLANIVNSIYSNINYTACKNCGYKIYKDLFGGRTADSKKWGETKLRLIKLLGEGGEMGSNEIKAEIAADPRKKERRLNHHYELIKKRRIGTRSRTEWFWSLNDIGKWIFDNTISKDTDFEEFFDLKECPLCKNNLENRTKAGWRDKDFEGDIFWDMIRNINKIPSEDCVYDVVLPYEPVNDHMFVVNGFIVHNSAGVNLPAYRVIIRDLKRFAKFRGMDYLPNMEIEQMLGRAGRPKYDSEGEGILIPKTQIEAAYAWENYIKGQPEKIYSKLGVEPVLRVHALSLIASNTCKTKGELFDFFSKTFYAKQFEDFYALKNKIEKVLELLEKFKFITISGSSAKSDNPFKPANTLVGDDQDLKPTKIGKRVSELYIDPITANYIVSSIEKIKPDAEAFSLLHVMCRCLEARPLLSVKKGDAERIDEVISKQGDSLIDKPPKEWDIEYDDYMDSIKTACFFLSWIEEYGEDKIMETFGVTPGELRARLDIADWLLYSMSELALLLDHKDVLRDVRKTRIRMEYGIKEELLALIKLKGIGRVRARLLFNSGVRDLGDLKKAPLESLSRLVGPKVAENLKEQVNL